MLDALDGTTLARMSLSTAKAVRQEHRMPFARSLRHALRIFCQAHNALQVAPPGGPHAEALVTNLERATKLLHITPALLQSSDGRCSRQGRYNEYTRGELTGLIDWLVLFAGRSRQKAREDTPEARRTRASKLAHERGGITKAANALISPPAAPRDSRTLATLRGKHPTEDPAAIAIGKAQAERRAGITAVGEQEQQPNVTSEPLDTQGQIPEMENLFEEATVKAVIKKANPQSAAGPSGLRYSHLQAALCDELVEDLAAFATLVFSSRVLPQVFWTLHTSANLSALGQKARPVACGDVLRRVIGAVFCRRYGRKLADYFQPWGQYGVAVSGGVEIMALTATLGFEEGCTILSYDGANAFNSIYRHRFLPALAEIVPSVVPYASNLYAREPPKLLFALDGGGSEVVESARGVQQGCNLGPLCYSAGSLKILKEFRANPPVPGARAVSFIDDITVILPPERSLDVAAIGKVTEWLQERLGIEGISLNRRKSQALLADGVGPEQLTEEQRVAMDTTGLTVVRQGMRVVGVPVGTEQFQRDFLKEAVNGEPAELVRALAPMEDAQASFQILRLSATSRLSHLLRTVPPSITGQAAANYDALVEWALASIIAGDGAAAAGLPTPEEVAHDPTVCQNQAYLGHEALRQAHLPIREGGLGLTSSSSIKGAAYIGCHALVLGRVVAASARGNLPSLLERLPERPMASALIEELKTVATEAKKNQIEDAVGSSWAALAAEENPQGRGIGTLLVEAGAGGGEGRGRGRGGGGRRGHRGGGVRQQVQLEDPLATQSDGGMKLSQTNRGVGGVCVGVVPRVQSKLSRALHAHRGKKHDAAEPVGGMCHGNGCRQETTRLHAISCTRTGWSSLTHNRVLHQALARSLRESKVQFVVEDTWPFRERASGENSRLNPLRMDITTEAGALFNNHPRLKNKGLLLDITIVNPCVGSNLGNAARHVGKHLADAVERNKNKYRGSFPATYSLLPLAMSTCGEVGSDLHALIKELAIRRVQHRSETHSNESQHLAEGTEVARLRRRFSFVLQQALSFRTRHHFCRQGVALASTRQFRSQGPVSVQAHRTGGVTEAQEGAIGVGGEIRVGGGNGDGSGVGDGNGDVNGHGDGDGAGVETGVGVNEGAQDGNGDGSGDRAGMGTEVETHRRTPDGNGDGPKVSSEDGNGDEGNGNEGRVGDGEKEAKKRKKPLNSCRRQGGNGGDFGGTRKRCRKGSVGPVAANSNIVEINKEAGGGAEGTLSLSKNCTSRESVSPLSRLIRDFRNKYH